MVIKQNLKNVFKKSLICSLSAISVLSLTNCSKGPSNDYIDNAIALVYQDDKPYLINAAKDLYPLSYYDEIIELFNDYIAVKKDGKYGFIDRTGKLVVSPVYDKVYPMYEEKAVVIKDGVYQIINNTGKNLYTFENNIISESYFTNNYLVISQDSKYGYLKYDSETSSFESSEIIYDFAKPYQNGYAVVGNYETTIVYKEDDKGNLTTEIDEIIVKENVKYNYIDESFNLLFKDFTFDYADSFYNGYAIVGYYDTVNVPGVDGGKASSLNGLIYKYITPKGTTLHFNHSYVFSIIVSGTLQSTNRTYKDELYLPYVQPFTSDLTFVAKYRYSTVQSYLKEYMLVDLTGQMNYTDAIYSKTGYLFGHDSGHVDQADFQAQSAGQFSVGNVVKLNDTYAFIAGNTLYSPTWKVYYLKYDPSRNDYAFETATWNVIEKVTDESGKTTEILPEWAKEYKKHYLRNVTSNILLQHAIENPYEMTNLSFSKYYSDECLVNTVRLSNSNDYGLVKYESSTIWNESEVSFTNKLTASFVLDPIYDKIIY